MFLVFPKVLKKNKKSGKPKILKKTKENQKNTKENQKQQKIPQGKPSNKVVKGFRPTLGYVFLVFFGFPGGFQKTKKTFGKTENTKENQRKQKIPKKTEENQRKTKKNFGKTKKTKLLKVSDPLLDMFFGFPESF